jgi:hypothetical protein
MIPKKNSDYCFVLRKGHWNVPLDSDTIVVNSINKILNYYYMIL